MQKVTSSVHKAEAGFSVIEMIVTLGLMAVITGIAISNIKALENPLADASFQMSHYIRLVRARAISRTTSVIIQPSSPSEVIAFSSDSCNGEMAQIEELTLRFPEGATLSDTDWTVCINQRGLSDTNIIFELQNQEGKVRSIELALGGGVRIR